MKQLVFGFPREESSELRVPLDDRTQEDLVELMAAAIAAVHTKGMEGRNDTCSHPDQGDGEAPGA